MGTCNVFLLAIANVVHSGIQKDILAFYKMVLRKAQTQPPEIRKCIEDYARREFRKNVDAPSALSYRHMESIRTISIRLIMCATKV